MIVDLFAGGGGASVGIEAATGRIVDLALNHSREALSVHRANHPDTLHLEADIWSVRPKVVVGRKKVELLWASPDCTHFSVAKGGKPRQKNIRSLAYAVVEWARAVRPQVICLENVREFLGWGPLDADGKPIKARMGETFDQWKAELELLGYQVDHRILDASHFGAPTRRRRLFLVARCDGQPIRWPAATHGPGLKPYRTAAECIDWSIPCPSIFAEKTLWRIAQGIRRFVLENPTPYIVKVNHGKREARGEPIVQPLSTVTAERRGHALVAPTMLTIDNKSSPRGFSAASEPLPTTTTENRHAVVAPALIQTGYGERPGQRPRYLDIQQPIGTLVDGQKHGLVVDGQKHGLVAAFLAKHFGGVVGIPPTVPFSTVTTQDHHSLVAAHLAKFRGECHSSGLDEPAPTVTASGMHIAEVRAFLTAYYGSEEDAGQRADEPLRTITTKDRLGLVTVAGVDYQIVDIGMRMLEPHELLRAQFGRFAENYDLSPARTKSGKVRLIGNSVCPEVAEALVAANFPAKVRKAA